MKNNISPSKFKVDLLMGEFFSQCVLTVFSAPFENPVEKRNWKTVKETSINYFFKHSFSLLKLHGTFLQADDLLKVPNCRRVARYKTFMEERIISPIHTVNYSIFYLP